MTSTMKDVLHHGMFALYPRERRKERGERKEGMGERERKREKSPHKS